MWSRQASFQSISCQSISCVKRHALLPEPRATVKPQRQRRKAREIPRRICAPQTGRTRQVEHAASPGENRARGWRHCHAQRTPPHILFVQRLSWTVAASQRQGPGHCCDQGVWRGRRRLAARDWQLSFARCARGAARPIETCRGRERFRLRLSDKSWKSFRRSPEMAI